MVLMQMYQVAYDATGEHSGDLMDTSSSSHKDSDIDDI